MQIAAANADLNNWSADVPTLGTNDQRPVSRAAAGGESSRFHVNQTGALSLDNCKELTVVQRMENCGGTKKPSKNGGATAAASVAGGGPKRTTNRMAGGEEGGGKNTRRIDWGVALASKWASGFFTDFTAELNCCGTQRGMFHDRWQDIEFRKLLYDTMWDRIPGGKPMQMQRSTTAVFCGGNEVSGDGIAVDGGGSGSAGRFAWSRGGGEASKGGSSSARGPFGGSWGCR